MVNHQGGYLVLVRKYRLSKTNVLVESPNVDLNAQTPRIIIRTLDGEYKGEPRAIDDATSLRDDVDKRAYRDIAHGVYICAESDAGNFPVWVCLERNSEHRQDKHISVLNLYRLEFSVVPLANICWVPSHKASNGDMHTIISDPGRHGYTKETFIPTIIQNIRFPEQAKFSHPPSSLPGFTRLGQKRRMELYNRQLMGMQEARTPRLGRLPQLYTAINENSGLPWFVNDDLPSSDEENTNTCPLHRHSTDKQCHFSSMHRLHRIFASRTLEHCVTSSSSPTGLCEYSTESIPTETGTGLNPDIGIECLQDELQRLGDKHCFRDAEWLQQMTQDWNSPAIHAPSTDSGPGSPRVELLPDALDGLSEMGNLPELVAPGTIWGRQGPEYHDLRTPEPPEMLR
ncbi:hypothetical protein O1611_g7992 [Lasiodiplodia mahajangana]|uniref:Uncharacterized protein n=1 Tax=Lasiodiplodia mahajangana TaxID=1108764 RepID=A0ACC2JDP3_9PEZI|nr:hypothetical protein O1611_g7992 [Lasiodiplodia mahajangana]